MEIPAEIATSLGVPPKQKSLTSIRQSFVDPDAIRPAIEPSMRIGLALGGGFARGIAHAGVLRVFEPHHIPIHCSTGISAGAVVATAFASGAAAEEIARTGCSMRFGDVGGWSLGRLGLVGSQRMNRFLEGY